MATNKKTYQQKKEAARQQAIDWQDQAAEQNLSYGERAEAGEHFEKLGRHYGLLQEFRENGIC